MPVRFGPTEPILTAPSMVSSSLVGDWITARLMESNVGTRMHSKLVALREAALNIDPVAGYTHRLYRYPARFSPHLASAAIRLFSKPGQLVLDPFSGGGTTAVEAVATGRSVVGTDVSELATFVARLKTTRVRPQAARVLQLWAEQSVPRLRHDDPESQPNAPPVGADRNLRGPTTEVIRRLIGVSLSSIPQDPDPAVETVARGAILGAAQWAIDGRRQVAAADAFRYRLQTTVHRILHALSLLWVQADSVGSQMPFLATADAQNVGSVPPLADGRLADLVVTSPPYPGVHILYHRWQVAGGKETAAPFWIAGARSWKGAAHYTMGGRKSRAYFGHLGLSISAIRRVMRKNALLIQVVGFSQPRVQLDLYLDTMRASGFVEICGPEGRRIWRKVPRRRWYVSLHGRSHESREVVLVHRAS